MEEHRISARSNVFVARNGGAERITTILSADEVGDLVERMLRSLAGRGWASSSWPPGMTRPVVE